MKGTNLGEFEELLLLVVIARPDQAYSVAVAREIDQITGRKVVHSVVHAGLIRLEKKGFVKSEMRDATEERGGRRKRMFRVTAAGIRTLEAVKAQRDQLWHMVSSSEIENAYAR